MAKKRSISLLPTSERDRQLLLEFLQLYKVLDHIDRLKICERMLYLSEQKSEAIKQKQKQSTIEKRVGNTLYLNLSGTRE